MIKFLFKKPKNENEQKDISFKKERSNPHKIWMILIVMSIFFVIGELIFFSWYFLKTTKSLDDITNPEIKTNSAKIKSITKTIENIEMMVNSRIGTKDSSSQNEE